jgi:hypothetical protein
MLAAGGGVTVLASQNRGRKAAHSPRLEQLERLQRPGQSRRQEQPRQQAQPRELVRRPERTRLSAAAQMLPRAPRQRRPLAEKC